MKRINRYGIVTGGLLAVFLLLSGGRAPAQDSLFPGLTTYLVDLYRSPFRMVGKVAEVSGPGIMFSRGDLPIVKGQHLWVGAHKPGVSPQLQAQVAWVRVVALYTGTALARVDQVVGRPVQVDDLVLTPPAPVIYLYTNIADKHAFPPYEQLLRALLADRLQVTEVEGGVLPEKPGAADLIIRLEKEGDSLACQVKRLKGGRVLYSEIVPGFKNAVVAVPAGHGLQLAGGGTVPGSGISVGAAARPLPGVRPPFTHAARSFRKAGKVQKADFYRLVRPYSRVVRCDLEGDGTPELALLGKASVAVFRVQKGRLNQVFRYSFGGKDVIPLHLHAVNLDGRPGDELLVTLSKRTKTADRDDNRLVSRIATFHNGRFRTLAGNWPYYLRVIEDRKGRKVPLAQEEGDYKQYAGPVFRIAWDKKSGRIKIAGAYPPAKDIYSIYQFNLVPEDRQRVVILEPNGVLHGYFTPDERVEASGDRKYGPYQEIGYPLKLEDVKFNTGGFDKTTYRDVFAPRRFVLRTRFDNQMFIIYKERFGGFFKDAVKKTFGRGAEGEDQVSGIRWEGNRIVETWSSRRLSKDILDFTFLKNPDRLVVLCRDDDGYALEALY